MAKTPENSIIIANDLRTGRSVYLTEGNAWSESVADAEVLSAEAASARLEIASAAEQSNLVIDPYLVGVESGLSALDIREQIRLTGPTILTQDHVAAAA